MTELKKGIVLATAVALASLSAVGCKWQEEDKAEVLQPVTSAEVGVLPNSKAVEEVAPSIVRVLVLADEATELAELAIEVQALADEGALVEEPFDEVVEVLPNVEEVLQPVTKKVKEKTEAVKLDK